jgi:hypothetical protein
MHRRVVSLPHAPALPKARGSLLACAGIMLAVTHIANAHSLPVADLSLKSTVTNSDPTVDDQVFSRSG